MKFGKTLFAALLAAGLTTAATAQTQWTGFYLGANAGYGWGSSSVATSPAFDPTGYFAATSIPAIAAAGNGKQKPSGFTGGLTTGYNFQSANIVYGAEFDFNYDHASETRSNTAVYPCCAPTSFTLQQTTGTDDLMTLRGRIGYASGKALYYGTAGIAHAKLKYSETFTDTFAAASESAAQSAGKTGWTLGVGYELALQDKWSFKAEFLHTHFGSISGTSNNLTATPSAGISAATAFTGNTFTHSTDLSLNVLRVGINYRF